MAGSLGKEAQTDSQLLTGCRGFHILIHDGEYQSPCLVLLLGVLPHLAKYGGKVLRHRSTLGPMYTYCALIQRGTQRLLI